ncbi:MAG: Hpt domain-containing protein [Treponema sp.]|nr:Hpt domain-containing protein [Treponema sp.]
MADITYVDEEEGKKRLMNNGKLYAKILTKFKTDTNLGDLLASVDAQDWEKAQAAAHTVKGIAANLSLIELARQALDAETQLKGKALNPQTLEGLKMCFSATLVKVDEVIAKYA